MPEVNQDIAGNIAPLVNEVQVKTKEYRTDSYPMSIGEIINLYRDEEIIINPDFQRFYRWTDTQKSRFIESILLGIPIPPVFVYQDKEGKWEVVDGLQRLSTIFQFIGVLKDEHGGKLLPLSLLATKMLPSLNNVTWPTLPKELQLRFKRSSLGLSIIKHESHPDAKFEVFQRLNTGGTFLADQELRNCLMIMVDKDFYEWVKRLSENQDFQGCISLTERLMREKYDMELVSRYLVYCKDEFDLRFNDVGEYITDRIMDLMRDRGYDRNRTEDVFTQTFHVLNELLGDNVFKKFNEERHAGKFLESLFEVIGVGLSHNINSYSLPRDRDIIITKIRNLWDQDDFTRNMGYGTNTQRRVPNIIPFGKRYFAR